MNCPQCSHPISLAKQSEKLFTCPYCSAALLIETLRQQKHDLYEKVLQQQSLITEGEGFRWADRYLQPLGYIQYEHNQGYLTDWWVSDEHDGFYWLSVDDEDYILSQDYRVITEPIPWHSLQLNREISLLGETWLLVKKQKLAAIASKGCTAAWANNTELLTLVGASAKILLINLSDNRVTLREGEWLDPFEIERFS